MRSWLTPPKILPTEPAQSAGPAQKTAAYLFFQTLHNACQEPLRFLTDLLPFWNPFFAFRSPFWSLWEPSGTLGGLILAVFGVLFGGFLRPCGKNASRGIFWRLEGSRGTPRMSFWHTQASVWCVSGLSVSGCLWGGKVAKRHPKWFLFGTSGSHFGDVF